MNEGREATDSDAYEKLAVKLLFVTVTLIFTSCFCPRIRFLLDERDVTQTMPKIKKKSSDFITI